MPSIEVSDSLLTFLRTRAAIGHDGDINAYLHSFLGVAHAPHPNEDRTVLEFVRSTTYAGRITPTKKYLALLGFLYRVDPIRFAALEGFTVPGSHRVLVSQDRTKIERSCVNATTVALEESSFYAMSPRNHEESRDFAVHVMRELGYPIGVWQAARATFNEAVDLSILD